jgi:hypothetical protein
MTCGATPSTLPAAWSPTGSPAASRSPRAPTSGFATATGSSDGDRSPLGAWARWSPGSCSEGTNDRPLACNQPNHALVGSPNKQHRTTRLMITTTQASTTVRPSCRHRRVRTDVRTALSPRHCGTPERDAACGRWAADRSPRPAGNGRQPQPWVSVATMRNLDAAGCPHGRCPPRILPQPGVGSYRKRSPVRRPLLGCSHRRCARAS